MDEDNGKGYGCFVMFVSAVAIIIAIASLLRWDRPYSDILAHEFIITVLATLITFVVAWQIWQVIDTKNTIKQIKEYVAQEESNRKKAIKDHAEKLSLLTFTANCVNDAIFMMTEMHHITHYGMSPARNQIGYNIAYRILLCAMRDVLKSNTPETNRLVLICLDNMRSCLANAEALSEQYAEYAKFDAELNESCDRYFAEIINNYSALLSHEHHLDLSEFNRRRRELSY